MIWKDFSKSFRDGDHAFLSPSQHAWYNYDDDKFVKVWASKLAASRGTELHALACKLIKMGVHLPDDGTTLSLYVNDAIDLKLQPEKKLWYSKYCFGTADAIDYQDYILRIHDLKTGTTKVSFLQLELYAALFFLCYPELKMANVRDVELRIYQNNDIMVQHETVEDILPKMDRIQARSKMLEVLESEYNPNGIFNANP